MEQTEERRVITCAECGTRFIASSESQEEHNLEELFGLRGAECRVADSPGEFRGPSYVKNDSLGSIKRTRPVNRRPTWTLP
jgi:hypothetical protein